MPSWDLPGSPVVKTPSFQCKGAGSIPGWGTKIPHATQHGQKKKKKKKKIKNKRNTQYPLISQLYMLGDKNIAHRPKSRS